MREPAVRCGAVPVFDLGRNVYNIAGDEQLRGLARLISRETGMPVFVADNPLDCVVEGTQKRLEMGIPMDYYERRRRY